MNIRAPERYGLLPYQSDFAANRARFKIGLWARQTGKDHTCTFEAVVDSIRNAGTLWIIVAAGERQARESLAKAKEWAETLRFQIADYNEERVSPAARMQSAEIRWANGSRLLALPANPQTIRGYSANLILTEFAFHEDPGAIWKAIYPSISNPLRGGLKKLRIISTPNGMTNKFADLWLNGPTVNPSSLTTNGHELTRIRRAEEKEGLTADFADGTDERKKAVFSNPRLSAKSAVKVGYFKSKVTIHDAIRAGLPLDAVELQAGLNDPDAWAQEYLCEFMDSSSVLFPYDLISACESAEATESGVNLSQLEAARRGHLFAGIDFGRRNHLTVCWILEKVPKGNPKSEFRNANFISGNSGSRDGQVYLTREVLTLKDVSTPEQLDILLPRLRHCWRICVDATGAGVGLGDYLVQRFGEYVRGGRSRPAKGGRVELCQFTSGFKGELFPRLRSALEQRAVRIPVSREIREDLHGVQKSVSVSGQISYRAGQSTDGHSDRTTALALALRAATQTPIASGASTVYVPENRGWTWRNTRIIL